MEVLSNRLRMLRMAMQLTQQQVAETLKMDRSSYSYYEAGRSTPDAQCLIELAKLYRVSVDFLLGLENESGGLSVASPDSDYAGVEREHLRRHPTREDLTTISAQEKALVLYYRLLPNREEILREMRRRYETYLRGEGQFIVEVLNLPAEGDKKKKRSQ